jgi:hypothetical protein
MKRSLIPSAIIIAALTLTGCASGLSSSSDSVGMSDGSVGAPEAGAPQFSDQSGTVTDLGAGAVSDRQVITNGYMTVSVENPLASVDDAIQITEDAGGRVDARTEYAPTNGDQGSASLTLRLPSATLTASIDELKALGEVESVSLTAQDVTTQSQDLDARITALRASLDRLLALMSNATNTDSLIALETAISERQGNLESLEAQQRYLADQVTLSTIELSLISPANAPADVPQNFWSGIVVGWNAFISAMSGLLVILGVILPWIAIAALISAAVLLIVRWSKRRHPHAAEPQTGASDAAPTDKVEPKKVEPTKVEPKKP